MALRALWQPCAKMAADRPHPAKNMGRPPHGIGSRPGHYTRASGQPGAMHARVLPELNLIFTAIKLDRGFNYHSRESSRKAGGQAPDSKTRGGIQGTPN